MSTRESVREHGHITSVAETELGSVLAAAAAAGATQLTVTRARDFDTDGGVLRINGQRIRYTTVAKRTGVIDFKPGRVLAASADAGDTVAVWDRARGAIAVEKTARVDLGDGTSDDIHAVLASSVTNKLPPGPRATGDREGVVVAQRGIDWKVVDLLGVGDPDAARRKFDQVSHVVTVAGDQVINLLPYWPVADSVRVFIEGEEVDPEDGWSLDGDTATIQGALVNVGDLIDVEYAYTDDHTQVRWEHNDPYTLTGGPGGDIERGYAIHTLKHTSVVEESVDVDVSGVRQTPNNDYTVDHEAGVITWPLDGWEPAGLVMWPHYQYLNGPVAAPTVIRCANCIPDPVVTLGPVTWATIPGYSSAAYRQDITVRVEIPADALLGNWYWYVIVAPNDADATSDAGEWRGNADTDPARNPRLGYESDAFSPSPLPVGSHTATVTVSLSTYQYNGDPEPVGWLRGKVVGVGFVKDPGGLWESLPQENANGLLGVTNLDACQFYWGPQIAQTGDSREVPLGPIQTEGP